MKRKETMTYGERYAAALFHGGVVAAAMYFELYWLAAGWALFTVTYCLDELIYEDADEAE